MPVSRGHRSYSREVQALINNEVLEITNKIQALDSIRAKLEQDLLKLQEDELELNDECMSVFVVSVEGGSHVGTVEGVKERLELERSAKHPSKHSHIQPPSSRRRKGMMMCTFCLLALLNYEYRSRISSFRAR